MCLAVDEDWFQSHQNVVWVFDTQQYAAACASSAARLIKLALPDSFVENPIPADSIEGFCDMNDLYAAPLTKM